MLVNHVDAVVKLLPSPYSSWEVGNLVCKVRRAVCFDVSELIKVLVSLCVLHLKPSFSFDPDDIHSARPLRTD